MINILIIQYKQFQYGGRWTKSQLNSRGISAEFTGCLTLTLQISNISRNNKIYYVDIDNCDAFINKNKSQFRQTLNISK